jgi:hypothetical protein
MESGPVTFSNILYFSCSAKSKHFLLICVLGSRSQSRLCWRHNLSCLPPPPSVYRNVANLKHCLEREKPVSTSESQAWECVNTETLDRLRHYVKTMQQWDASDLLLVERRGNYETAFSGVSVPEVTNIKLGWPEYYTILCGVFFIKFNFSPSYCAFKLNLIILVPGHRLMRFCRCFVAISLATYSWSSFGFYEDLHSILTHIRWSFSQFRSASFCKVPSDSLHHSYILPEDALLCEYVAPLTLLKLELMLLCIGLV